MIAPWIIAVAVPWSAWLLTWTFHAAVCQGASLLLQRWMPSPRARDLLWKGVLVVPVASATTAVVSGPRGALTLAALTAVRRPWNHLFASRYVAGSAGPAPQIHDIATTTVGLLAGSLIITLAVVAAIAGLRAFAMRRRDFVRALGHRRPVPAPHDCTVPSGIRLTASTTLSSPVALGFAEIAVPADIEATLDAESLGAILTHEVAHVDRRDPVWFALADLMQSVAPWHPFMRRLVSAMHRDAEFACDDVVRAQGEGRAMVRALAILAARHDPLAWASAAGSRSSPLELRARRLLEAPRQSSRMLRYAMVCAAIVCLIAIMVKGPRVTTEVALKGPGMRQVVDTVMVADKREGSRK